MLPNHPALPSGGTVRQSIISKSRKQNLLPLCFVVLLALLIAGSKATFATESNNVETRVNTLLSQMTLDEKIKILSGTKDEMHTPGIERLHIPELKMSDGPVGVRVWGRATAYPCGAMLAATWDRELARELGQALGRDCRARAVHILLAPGMDLYREPQCGRNFEYFGEDPYLAAQMAVGYVLGVQDEGVATSVKHYAANDQEIQRTTINTIVSERRLHEICLPPFKAAVQDGNAWTVMAAYNKVNGHWCTDNKILLTDILRDQWGFMGVLMSDWGAVNECLGPLTAGTDLEMGKTVYYTPANIKKYLQEGKVTQAQIDEHVRRILRMSVSLGFFDRPQEDKSIPLDNAAASATALKVAREGLTLLKNQDDFLPLSRAITKSIVVAGPNACPAVIGGGGSSATEPFSKVSLFDAIKSGAGAGVDVQYIPACPGADPTGDKAFDYQGVFEPLTPSGQRGLRADYFDGPDLKGTPKTSRTDFGINNYWGEHHPDLVTTAEYSVRWTGKIKAAQTDVYVLACASDGSRVFLDGKPIFDNWSTAKGIERSCSTLPFNRDEVHDLVVEYHHLRGNADMQFTWGKASSHLTGPEMEAIRNADTVVYSCGFNPSLEGEGSDRTYDLPGNQSEFLENIVRLNRRTVVVLNAGGNVAMDAWIDSVPVLMHAWYPGENGNIAVAEALFGDLNPSGHLPDTFEKRWEDSPAYGNYPGDPADGGTVKFAEDIYVGYRWFDKKNIAPRFPFGYGLSYTTFALADLQLSQGQNNVTATGKITNTGAREGACVVQLYVRPIDRSIGRPTQELKGFGRVQLKPGESRTMTLELNRDSFATYDENKHTWIYPAGEYEIALGTSSRDIGCSRTIFWSQQ
jgi:beta-glucosidase